MKKKFISRLIVMLVVCSFVFVSGCGDATTNTVEKKNQEKIEKVNDLAEANQIENDNDVTESTMTVLEADEETIEEIIDEMEIIESNSEPTLQEMELLSYAFRNLGFVSRNHLSGELKDICTNEMVDSFMWGMTAYCEYDYSFNRYCELCDLDKGEHPQSLSIEEYNQMMYFLTPDTEMHTFDKEKLTVDGEIPINFYTPTGEAAGEASADLTYIDGEEGSVKVSASIYNDNSVGYNRENISSVIATIAWSDKSAFDYRLLNIEEIDGTVKVIDVQATSTLDDSESYQAMNLIDGDFSTAWVEGVDSDGEGEVVTFTFDRDYTIIGMLVTNGYTKNDSTFVNNNRVKNLAVTRGDVREIFEMNSFLSECMYFLWDGNTLEEEVNDYTDFISFNEVVTTNTVELEILDVVNGEQYNDTCISEIVFIGY